MAQDYCKLNAFCALICQRRRTFISIVNRKAHDLSQINLDSLDRGILAILQRDNTTSQRTIGEAVGLSAPAVQRRIKRLQAQDVIQANVAVLDPAKVGQFITMLVQVAIESERLDLIDAVKQSFIAEPEVQQCYYVTGDVDFFLVVTVPTMAAYEALTRRLFFDNANVKRFQTAVVMNRVKVALSVPIE